MKVRMIVAISGERDGVQWPVPGGEIEVPDAEGAELCTQGYAEPVATPPPRHTATNPPAEKRASGRPRKA